MQIKNYLASDIKVKELNEKVDSMIKNLSKELSTFYSTYSVVNKYTPVIKELTEAYNKAFNQKCYITSFKGNNLYAYINRNSKQRLKYNIDSYFIAVQYEVALLIAKYEQVHECQIKLAFMNVLINNYMYYTQSALDNSFILEIEINTIKNQYNTIMDMEIKNLPLIKENEKIQEIVRNNSKRSPIKEVYVPTKPTKAEHLTSLFEEGMTQREKVKAIVNYWDCSESTAERYMKKYGLWTQVKNIKKDEPDYKALYEKALKENEALKAELTSIKNKQFQQPIHMNFSKIEMINEISTPNVRGEMNFNALKI